jgi:cytochrome b
MSNVAVPVWDLPTRIFHWALVAAVLTSYATGGRHGLLFAVHTASGYAIALLLLFRFAWGFVGSSHSRFADFVYSRRTVVEYARGLVRLAPSRFVGHNPLGGWMVVLLLATLTLAIFTGLFSSHGEGEAHGILFPLITSDGKGDGLGEVHELLGNLVVLLACVHLAGVLADWLVTRENLVRAMVTGEKTLGAADAARERPLAPARRAVIVAILVAVAGFALFQNTDFTTLTSHDDGAHEHRHEHQN